MKEPFLINPIDNPLMIMGNPKKKKFMKKVRKVRKVKKYSLKPIKKIKISIPKKVRKIYKKRSVKKGMSRKRIRPVFYRSKKGYKVSEKSILLKRSRGRILNPPIVIAKNVPPVMDIVYLGVGGIASRVIPTVLPLPARFKVGVPRIILQGVSSVALSLVVDKVFKQPRIARLVMLGGLTATAITLIDAVILRGRLAEGDFSVAAYLPETEVSAYLPESEISQNEADLVSQNEADLVSDLYQDEQEVSQNEELI